LTDREIFSSRLVIPASCERLAQSPSREIREAIERSNTGVLAFLLQGVDLEAMHRPADEHLAEALAPLRTKLDMLIDMLGRLSYRDVELPPLCEIELSSTLISWISALPQSPGDWLRIKLYFDPIFREAIMMLGEVSSCAASGEGSDWRIRAELCEVSEGVGENIARLALLTQRRQRTQRSVNPAVRGER
jgi:hypothetical protein